MIDFEIAKKEFLKYTDEYDLNVIQIKRKIGHSLRVMKISEKLAKDVGFSSQEIEIATLIGLLHDIGRFNQYTKFQTFKDCKSIDHGEEGEKILNNNNYIKKYIDNDKYENIIKIAIKNHNKYEIEKNLNEEEKKFCELIKDADKLDILYELQEIYWKDDVEDIKNNKISEEVFEQFKNKQLIKNETKTNTLDCVIGVISFIYDISFKETFEIIKKENYINGILDRFEYQENTKNQIEEIKLIANKYIEEQIKKG